MAVDIEGNYLVRSIGEVLLEIAVNETYDFYKAGFD